MTSRADVQRLVSALISRLREQHQFCNLEDRPSATISLSDANNKWNKLALALVERHRTFDGRMPPHKFDARLEEVSLQDHRNEYQINITNENREWNKIALALLQRQKETLKHK